MKENGANVANGASPPPPGVGGIATGTGTGAGVSPVFDGAANGAGVWATIGGGPTTGDPMGEDEGVFSCVSGTSDGELVGGVFGGGGRFRTGFFVDTTGEGLGPGVTLSVSGLKRCPW